MTDSVAAITDIIVDCTDPQRLAEFWSALLERPIKGRKGPYVWLTRSVGGIGLGFQQVEEPKDTKTESTSTSPARTSAKSKTESRHSVVGALTHTTMAVF
jgi:hypothetical protein